MPEADPTLHVVLHHPQIPQNTGNIGRLCLAIGATLHLIHPLGFETDEKAVRRAGLDYWRSVSVVEHPDEAAFWEWAAGRRVHLFSSHGARTYAEVTYRRGDVLLFGPESCGLPRDLVARMGALRIPMWGPTRSLNLSNAVAVAAYRALQDLFPEQFPSPG